ncbi:LuxR family transcriptional regulator [Actinomadura sp. ATCC 31491]|uniref:LuxR family transcriptional regulator n=1 Tax=Actinomadura luzonensis TaxID=2805427 RepID=A0ABT0FVA7_9ACTN|nr:LuxR family transcriptional regulator [Actinomadura luzonensis]MCK2216267.1 LuxR family transcriptional regulator [Actinomadura luzonensis]
MAEHNQRQGMALLRELLDDAVAGRGRIAVVTGAIATGKSHLLYGLTEQAFDHGALPLVATGSRAERDLPLGVLSQLVHNTPMMEQHRAVTLGLLQEGARAELAGDTLDHLDVQIVDALCTILLELSERCPLLIAVDDAHHADRASQLCLTYLARRIKYAKIMLVFAAPDHAAHQRSLLHSDLLRQPHCRPVRLAHLTAEAVLRRVAERAGPEAAGRFGAACHELSGGNRLLVDALVEDFQAGGGPGERYAEAVLTCLHGTDPDLLLTARGLAVLGEPDGVARLLGHGPAAVAQALQALNRAGLLAGGRFRHEGARAAVLAALDATDRTGLHRRAAELTHDEGAPVAVVAEHLLLAGCADDPWALSVLEDAAGQALRDGGVEAAIEYLKLAWQGCGDERRRARIATKLVRAAWRINPSTPAGHLAELTAALHKGHLGGGDAVVLAKALLWHGHVADAKDVLHHLRELGGLDREGLAELAVARAWLRGACPSFLAHLPEAGQEESNSAAHSLGVSRRIESANALVRALTEAPRPETTAVAERVLRGSRLDEMSMDTVESALLTLTYSGRPDRAAPWCDAFVEEAASRQAPSRQARLSAIRAEIALRTGDLAAAARDARRALEIIPPGSWGVAVGGPLGALLLAGAAMSRHEECLPYVTQPVPEAMLETRFGLLYLHGKARYTLTAGQAEQALRDLRLCGELMGLWGLDAPEFIPWRVDAAEALVRLGDHEQARLLLEEQLRRSDRRSRRVHGMAMRVLAATGESRHRVMLLRRSAELLQTGGDRYELARTLFDLIEAYHTIGEYRRAGMLTRRARSLAVECSADGLSQALSPDGEHDGDASGVQPILSDAERRVAALAADGYSNRDISAKLYITVSTVEQHLTRVYRKLNVTRRSDLPARLVGEQS